MPPDEYQSETIRFPSQPANYQGNIEAVETITTRASISRSGSLRSKQSPMLDLNTAARLASQRSFRATMAICTDRHRSVFRSLMSIGFASPRQKNAPPRPIWFAGQGLGLPASG